MSAGIFLECTEHGPESYQLCSSYYYMGELFQRQQAYAKARSYFSKIAQIWKKFIIEQDLKPGHNPMYSSIDPYFYQEALQHLNVIRNLFENEVGTDNVVTAEVYMSFALVCLKNGHWQNCQEDL